MVHVRYTFTKSYFRIVFSGTSVVFIKIEHDCICRIRIDRRMFVLLFFSLSQVRFLRMTPFSYYFCKHKNCNCSSLRWNMGIESRKCLTCGHPPMKHYSYFNKSILNPIKRYGSVGDGRKAFMTLKDDILNEIMLRRTKLERAKDIKLPTLTINVEMLELDAHERDFYSCIYKRTRSKFDTYVKKGT